MELLSSSVTLVTSNSRIAEPVLNKGRQASLTALFLQCRLHNH